MAKKAKPRWDLAGLYVRGGLPMIHLKENELTDIVGEDISEENLSEFLKELNLKITTYLLTEKSLNGANIPTDAEFKATFEDLINSINSIGHKLSVLTGSPFDHMIDIYLLDKCPGQMPSELIHNTIINLDLIQQAATQMIENVNVKSGRRRSAHNNISMLAEVARIYEKSTGKKPTKYCGNMGEGEYARLAGLFYEKAGIPITTDFCNQVKQAIDKYRASKNDD